MPAFVMVAFDPDTSTPSSLHSMPVLLSATFTAPSVSYSPERSRSEKSSLSEEDSSEIREDISEISAAEAEYICVPAHPPKREMDERTTVSNFMYLFFMIGCSFRFFRVLRTLYRIFQNQSAKSSGKIYEKNTKGFRNYSETLSFLSILQ